MPADVFCVQKSPVLTCSWLPVSSLFYISDLANCCLWFSISGLLHSCSWWLLSAGSLLAAWPAVGLVMHLTQTLQWSPEPVLQSHSCSHLQSPNCICPTSHVAPAELQLLPVSSTVPGLQSSPVSRPLSQTLPCTRRSFCLCCPRGVPSMPLVSSPAPGRPLAPDVAKECTPSSNKQKWDEAKEIQTGDVRRWGSTMALPFAAENLWWEIKLPLFCWTAAENYYYYLWRHHLTRCCLIRSSTSSHRKGGESEAALIEPHH